MIEQEQLWMVWLAAFITLGVYSFLYSDNKVYRILLNAMIGLGVGYRFIIDWKTLIGPKWWEKVVAGFGHLFAGEPGGLQALWILVGLLGALWYFQLSRKYLWLSRIVIGLSVGAGAGVVFKSQFLMNAPQVTDSFRPLIARTPTALWPNGTPLAGSTGPIHIATSINNIIFVVSIICVMIYFFFSFSHDNKVVGTSAKIGRWVLMISFGAFFGNTVMTRMSVFLERLKYLIEDWAILAIPKTPWYYMLSGAILLAFIILMYATRRPPSKPPIPEPVEGEPTPEIPVGRDF